MVFFNWRPPTLGEQLLPFSLSDSFSSLSHVSSGAPITREEVYPGKSPENQFSVELFEAWAWKRTWKTSGGRGFCFAGAQTRMERLLRVLWRKDFFCATLHVRVFLLSQSASAAPSALLGERSRPLSFCSLAARMLCFNFRFPAPNPC